MDNDAGIKTICFYARIHDILTWPTAKAEEAPTLEERVALVGEFIMKTGTKFGQFEITLEKGALDSKGAGSAGNSSAENLLKLFRYGLERNILGWIETYKNDDLVFIIEDLQGNHRVVGAPGLPAQIMPDWEVLGGDAVSSEKYVQINVRSVGRIAKFYDGTIPLTEAL